MIIHFSNLILIPVKTALRGGSEWQQSTVTTIYSVKSLMKIYLVSGTFCVKDEEEDAIISNEITNGGYEKASVRGCTLISS